MQLPCAPLPAKFPLWEKSEWRCAGQKHGYYIYYSYQKQCEVTFVGYNCSLYGHPILEHLLYSLVQKYSTFLHVRYKV